MKQAIHPTYYSDVQVQCACGNTFTTGSTKQQIRVEICSACHPFFTGEMKYVDTAGRVDKFKAKIEAASHTDYVKKKAKKAAKKAAQKAELDSAPQTMKEMMGQARKQGKVTSDDKKAVKASTTSDQGDDDDGDGNQ